MILSALQLTAVIFSVGMLIAALEDWTRRSEFSDVGLMSWPVADLGWSPPRYALMKRLREGVYRYTSFRLVLLTKLAAAVFACIAAAIHSSSLPVFTFLLAVTGMVALFRSGYGSDGADQMFVILSLSATASSLFPVGSLGFMSGFWFVASQLTLSYLVSGIYKACSRSWWDGTGLAGVLSTYSYGSNFLGRFFSGHRSLSVFVSAAVIIWETSFFIIWMLPLRVAMIYLAFGVCFHVGVAVVMGLNTFVFAFLSAYPICWYCLSARK